MRCFGCLFSVENSSRIYKIARDDEQILKNAKFRGFLPQTGRVIAW
jgi:hypothetical protein